MYSTTEMGLITFWQKKM